jgi:hypothetical protein
MASFLEAHDPRGFEAYLLVHAVASSPPWNCDYPAHTWVRGFGLEESATFRSAKAAVSKIIARLVARRLIARTRAGGLSSLTLLNEDGKGGE